VAAVVVAEDEDEVAEAAAERITALIEGAMAARGEATVCLTGGTTPEKLYALLADAAEPWRARIDWPRVHLFWGDERHVPPDHADSNYGMAARTLVDRVPVPPAQVHRMRGELADAADAAREYEPQLPATFDVMLLGLGEDAHIASIFPNGPLVSAGSDPGTGRLNTLSRPVAGSDPKHGRVAAVWAPHLNAWRITLTPPAVLAARTIVMVVAGDAKAEAVKAALDLPEDVMRYPAQLLRQADDRLVWIMDAAAAAQLRP
jgi:6-phosphogluconolactonase